MHYLAIFPSHSCNNIIGQLFKALVSLITLSGFLSSIHTHTCLYVYYRIKGDIDEITDDFSCTLYDNNVAQWPICQYYGRRKTEETEC